MLVGDTGLTLETDAEGGGHRSSQGMLSGVAPSTWLPPAHPARRRSKAGEARGTASTAHRVQRGGAAPLPAGDGGSLAAAGCGEGAAHSPQAARSPGQLRCHPRPGSPRQAEHCKCNALGHPKPTLAGQDSRCPGSSSVLTCHHSLSPAGLPAASSPHRRDTKKTARARAPGSLGHTAAPPRSLGGLSAQHQPGPDAAHLLCPGPTSAPHSTQEASSARPVPARSPPWCIPHHHPGITGTLSMVTSCPPLLAQGCSSVCPAPPGTSICLCPGPHGACHPAPPRPPLIQFRPGIHQPARDPRGISPSRCVPACPGPLRCMSAHPGHPPGFPTDLPSPPGTAVDPDPPRRTSARPGPH